ncbi:glucose-6-phosphate isomerase [Ectothiorhodospiraceae bacterium WFHF3C12]|nr:glucose-6-phosphate isomerase [Ectothiorhodospiraceae bacterium WFHF3C12]
MEGFKASPAWISLMQHRRVLSGLSLAQLFERDPHRFQRFSVSDDDLLLDYSKNRLTGETVELLVELAREADVEGWREALFKGEPVNGTEQRPALHTALRQPPEEAPRPGGEDVGAAVADCLQRMETISERVRGGGYLSDGEVRDVVSIGIGGSDLGPRLVVDALSDLVDDGGPEVHFVANLDGVELTRALRHCDPRTTLFVVVSKSFGTLETRVNAEQAMAWLKQAGLSDTQVRERVIAVTARPDRVNDLGLDGERVLPLWDWVGGRYSMWSAVGLPIALAFGMAVFRELLEGARHMDLHFREAPPERNMPMLMALLGIWYNNAFGIPSRAVVPYTDRLRLLPNYLQQLEMESNGKRVTRDGREVDYQTAPAVWGQTGTNAQHAFFQTLHQGTHMVPVDFIGVAEDVGGGRGDASQLTANMLAQSRALMLGRDEAGIRAVMDAEGLDADRAEALLPHRLCPGGRPSNTLLLRSLTPRSLGRLLALYEHRTFVQGVVWRINPFDQWGVELGKQLAGEVFDVLRGDAAATDLDASTRGMLGQLTAWGSE